MKTTIKCFTSYIVNSIELNITTKAVIQYLQQHKMMSKTYKLINPDKSRFTNLGLGQQVIWLRIRTC